MVKRNLGRCLLLDILNRKYMTQAELSELTGISRSQINEYIANTHNMSLYNAKKIAVVLKCHIDDLYDWNIKF